MLAIESVFDVASDIDLIDDLISILLQGSCKDNNLIILGHRFDELDTSRPHKEEAIVAILDVVDQCFVQIQHKSIDLSLTFWYRLEGIQKGRGHLWKVGKIVWELGLCSGGNR